MGECAHFAFLIYKAEDDEAGAVDLSGGDFSRDPAELFVGEPEGGGESEKRERARKEKGESTRLWSLLCRTWWMFLSFSFSFSFYFSLFL